MPRMHQSARRLTGDTRSLAENVVKSFGVKGVSMLVTLASTPAYLAFFDNNDVLGLWFTLIQVLTWLLTCDMGVGNGLRNELVVALASGNRSDAKKLVSSSYVFLCAIGGVVLLVVLFLSGIVDWSVVFNIDERSIDYGDLRSTITIILASVVIQLVLRLVTSILYALQKAYLPGVISLLTNSTLLVYCLGVVWAGTPHNIVTLAWVYAAAVNIPLLVVSIAIFGKRPDLRPSLREADKSRAVRVLKVGLAFLWLQMMSLLLNNSSSYLITILIGNAAVVEYQIYYRIFTIASTVALLCTTPVWSATTKAKTESNYTWLWKIYKLFCMLAALATALQFLLCVPLQMIFDIWLGEQAIQADLVASLIFALYGSLVVWSNVVTTFANGLQELKLQTIFLTLGAFINVPISIALTRLYPSYLMIVVSNIISYIPSIVVQTTWMTRYLRNKVRRNGRDANWD